MQVADYGIASLGHNVRLCVDIDSQDVLRRHRAYPVLDSARDAARDIDIWRDTSTSLTNLVGVIAPAVVCNCT